MAANMLKVKYIFPLHRTIEIDIGHLSEFKKHPDSVHRSYKKLFLKTPNGSYLINYNISYDSEEKLLGELKKVIVK